MCKALDRGMEITNIVLAEKMAEKAAITSVTASTFIKTV
jgi:molybdenum cofactor biosynthesis enzyme